MSRRLQVSGMTCANCVRHVTEALQSVAGVRGVQVNLADGTALVDGEAAPDVLVAAVAAAGYDAA